METDQAMEILQPIILLWQNKAPHQAQDTEYYSVRMVLYSLLESMGYDGEKLYKFTPEKLYLYAPVDIANVLTIK